MALIGRVPSLVILLTPVLIAPASAAVARCDGVRATIVGTNGDDISSGPAAGT